ncbi:Mss4-like protein, partial [Lactifluus volemus]
MPVELKGSCHCGAVTFTVHSSTPVPYQLCMCSICRKVGGTGGSINLGAHAHTLQITKGKNDISIYKAVLDRGTPRKGDRLPNGISAQNARRCSGYGTKR